jgi:hypothetical protein
MERYIVYVEHEGAWHVWDECEELKLALEALDQLLNEYENDCKLCQVDAEGIEIELMRRGFD